MFFINVCSILYRFQILRITKTDNGMQVLIIWSFVSALAPNSPWKVKVEFNFANGNHLLLSMKMIEKCTFAECFTRKCCRQIIIISKDKFDRFVPIFLNRAQSGMNMKRVKFGKSYLAVHALFSVTLFVSNNSRCLK